MPISLSQFERGVRFAGDYSEALDSLRERLTALQLAQMAHGRRAIILFEGWEGSGRKPALRSLAGAWDPCHFSAHCVSGHGFEQSERHWLTPYWSAVPARGRTALFYGSWYAGLVRRRASGELGDKEWFRAFDEINEFEAQQAEHGTLLVKLFFHISAEEQRRRLEQRLGGAFGQANRGACVSYWEEALHMSDARWAPWTVIDAGDERQAVHSALAAVAELFSREVPSDGAAEENVVAIPRERYA